MPRAHTSGALLGTILLLSCGQLGTAPESEDDWTGTTWIGKHTFRLGESEAIVHCDISWTTSGEVVTTSCRDCDFVFDLAFDLNDSSSSNGTCDFRMTDSTARLAYAETFSTYGPSVGTLSNDGSFVRLGSASLLDGRFTYTYDNEFDDYGGYYELFEERGSATLSPESTDEGDTADSGTPDDTGTR